MIELALPAGTIEEALVSFRAGADAVYFGMKEFSARRGAGNFSIDDLSRIRRYSKEHGRKIYVTVNTLIDDKTLPALYDTLEDIASIGADGIITQDLGVARIMRESFPSLPLHGSPPVPDAPGKWKYSPRPAWKTETAPAGPYRYFFSASSSGCSGYPRLRW